MMMATSSSTNSGPRSYHSSRCFIISAFLVGIFLPPCHFSGASRVLSCSIVSSVFLFPSALTLSVFAIFANSIVLSVLPFSFAAAFWFVAFSFTKSNVVLSIHHKKIDQLASRDCTLLFFDSFGYCISFIYLTLNFLSYIHQIGMRNNTIETQRHSTLQIVRLFTIWSRTYNIK